MPIDKKEFENEDMCSKVEDSITSFLDERKDRAFTSQEVFNAMHFHFDFTTSETTKISTFTIADFTALLQDLVRREKVRMNIVGERVYFMAIGYSGKCPKCGKKITKPRKTWKMAGRPDKKGKRLQLHIGLFECPKHGTFRTVLEKKKI
jgi:hypothetical protein